MAAGSAAPIGADSAAGSAGGTAGVSTGGMPGGPCGSAAAAAASARAVVSASYAAQVQQSCRRSLVACPQGNLRIIGWAGVAGLAEPGPPDADRGTGAGGSHGAEATWLAKPGPPVAAHGAGVGGPRCAWASGDRGSRVGRSTPGVDWAGVAGLAEPGPPVPISSCSCWPTRANALLAHLRGQSGMSSLPFTTRSSTSHAKACMPAGGLLKHAVTVKGRLASAFMR